MKLKVKRITNANLPIINNNIIEVFSDGNYKIKPDSFSIIPFGYKICLEKGYKLVIVKSLLKNVNFVSVDENNGYLTAIALPSGAPLLANREININRNDKIAELALIKIEEINDITEEEKKVFVPKVENNDSLKEEKNDKNKEEDNLIKDEVEVVNFDFDVKKNKKKNK